MSSDRSAQARWLMRAFGLCFVAGFACTDSYAGCSGTETQPFECGVPLDGDDDVIRYCGGEREICICATNYCAEPVDQSICKSGYRYLPDPFGPCWEGKKNCDPCVLEKDSAAKTIPVGSRDACNPVPSDPNGESGGGGSGGSSSVGASSSGESSGTGGTGGSGGLGGMGGTGGMAGSGGMGGGV